MSAIDVSAAVPAPSTERRTRRGPDIGLTVGSVLLGLWVLIAITVPLWARFDPISDQDLANRLQPPGADHWFGTDTLGRDVFTRVMYGARISIPLAFVAVGLSMVVGVGIGALAGFLGRRSDEVLMRITDITLAFPAMVLALAIAAALGPGLRNVVIAIVLVSWPDYARLTRGQVLTVRNREHVLAARSVGCDKRRIFRRHVLPFATAPLLVKATTDLGVVILVAAGLSFIGVGAVPPSPEWGAMVSDGRQRIDQWWISLFPGLAILTVVLAVNFVGDAMRDRIDPYHRRRRPRRWR